MSISQTFRKQDGTLAPRPIAEDGRPFITDREADMLAEKMVTRQLDRNPSANETVVVEAVQAELERIYTFTPEADQRLDEIA